MSAVSSLTESTWMRLRHALLPLLAALLSLAVAIPASAATASLIASRSAAPSTVLLVPDASAVASLAATVPQPGDAIVAMTSGAKRTGSAVVIAPDLVVTSVQVVKPGKAGVPAIMTVDGGFTSFTVVATDARLGLVLLRAPLHAQPVAWGKGRVLQADATVTALGIGTGNRQLLSQPGVLKSPAAATGNDLLITDIHIDPLVEGGALLTPDGRVVGIIVAKGQGAAGGGLGWAVTSEAVQEFAANIQKEKAVADAAAAQRAAVRWVKIAFLVVFLGLCVWAGASFRAWYKRMEAREELASIPADEPAALPAADDRAGD
jgi:S1-C subfamily serine protease